MLGTIRRAALGATLLALTAAAIVAVTATADAADAALPSILPRTGWVATASTTNAGEPAANMLDGNTATRWSTGTGMAAGQYVTIDMGTVNTLAGIIVDAGPSTGDYARGYQAYLSTDGSSWGSPVASGAGSNQVIDITFTASTARYVKIVQTGSAGNWWSIAELNARTASSPPPPADSISRAGWVVTASATHAGEPTTNMLDGDPATRWSTGTGMTSGQSITVDMGAAHNLTRISMDAGPSTGDNARGYQVYISADGSTWGSPVAVGAGTGALIEVPLAAQTARYVKIVQTGSAGNWWSIAELNAYEGTAPPVTSWVGGWAAALAGGGNSINNQTVRMVVHNTTPGTSVRVRLSNQYGSSPAPIGAVSVAVQSSGGNAVPGTRRTVTFSGSTTATVPAGADLASDAIAMTVAAEQNLLVSVYFSGNTGPSNWHWDGRDTTYYSASGNFAADDSTANYPASDNAWYYLAGLDVQSTTSQGTLVAFGDSITDGADSSLSANRRWPNYLARRLQAQPGGPAFGVVNAGIGGNRLLTDTNEKFGTSALHRFGHDALAQPGVTAVIVLEGINDIGNNIGPNGALTAQDLINGYQTLIQQAHAAGVKIYGATILPYQGAGYYSTGGDTIRQSVNTWILTSGAFDGAFDLSTAMANPANPLQLNPAYDIGDHLHPNDAGYQAMANAINLATLLG